ncbi:MAG: lytic transglycosylase domain-containing protein [Acidobacteriota bacterium]|nr:lytic transglycosylase domain-containing protein [Acidobacteriota bacterium]
MKKFPFACLIALITALPALAQSNYRFDNFDVRDGVRVESVETTSALPPAEPVRKTAKTGLLLNRSTTRPTETLYTPARSMSMYAGNSMNGFTTGDPKIDSYIVESSVRNGLDPVLIYAQMHTESSFKRMAVSPKGASGLMQLMPGTARRFGVKNIFDPRENIEGGARYMRFLLDAFDGDVPLALAGYNAGEGAVLKYGRHIPPYHETQEYVRRISQRYAMLRSGEIARNARSITTAQASAMNEEQAAPPAPSYERAVFAVRLPDGRLQLVSQ